MRSQRASQSRKAWGVDTPTEGVATTHQTGSKSGTGVDDLAAINAEGRVPPTRNSGTSEPTFAATLKPLRAPMRGEGALEPGVGLQLDLEAYQGGDGIGRTGPQATLDGQPLVDVDLHLGSEAERQ